MVDEQFERLKKLWYSHYNVKFELVRNLMYREAVFIKIAEKSAVIRCMKINATPYLDANIKRFKFNEETMNLYGSLGHFPNLPMFSFNMKDKRIQQDDFNKKFLDYMKGFDLLIDIDNEDLQLAYASAVKVKKIFDEYNVPLWLQYSGSKGFHCRIDYIDLPKYMKDMSWVELSEYYKRFAENLRMIEGIPDIDLSVFDLRRIAKTPYSVVYPYYFIALPLSDEEFNNFNLEMVSLPYNLNRIEKIRKRGLLKRKGTSEGILQMFKKYCEV